jgi:hypothetical protein
MPRARQRPRLIDVSPWRPLDEPPGGRGSRGTARHSPRSTSEVLTVQRAPHVTVHDVMALLTEEKLASRVVLNEEWEHRLYAERTRDA